MKRFGQAVAADSILRERRARISGSRSIDVQVRSQGLVSRSPGSSLEGIRSAFAKTTGKRETQSLKKDSLVQSCQSLNQGSWNLACVEKRFFQRAAGNAISKKHSPVRADNL